MSEKALHQDTQSGRVLAAISYFSIFFAPIILPIILWIFADRPASVHAAKSLGYHIITYIGPILFVLSVAFGTSIIYQENTTITVITIVIAILLFIVTTWYTIKNIYRGIKVLFSDEAYFRP
ncbi:MAG TPA: hypothetical protein VK115_09390 [Staphylococcus sp.]|nr:hypothetical protein [Staphylococcus sp.]